MSGNEFKELDIESKVKYVNELLQQGDSVNNIRTTLGIGKNYIADKFGKDGYKLNRNINQYIKCDDVVTNTTFVVKQNIKPSEPKKETNNINLINNRLDNNSITTNVVTDTTSIIHSSIDSYDRNDTTSSHYRIYTDIQEEFKKFCKDNRQYKVQDIISSAIKEYLDKYNK